MLVSRVDSQTLRAVESLTAPALVLASPVDSRTHSSRRPLPATPRLPPHLTTRARDRAAHLPADRGGFGGAQHRLGARLPGLAAVRGALDPAPRLPRADRVVAPRAGARGERDAGDA